MNTSKKAGDSKLLEASTRLTVEPPGLDLAHYRDLATDIRLAEGDADEFLRVLWEIMNGFVENAWDVRLIPAFLPEIFDEPSGDVPDAVDSDDDDEDTDDKT